MNFIKKPVKGMTDFLPADLLLRNAVLNDIRETYESFGFLQIETPMIEHIENLTSNQGGDNEKLIFKIQKRGASLTRAWELEDFEGLVDSGLRYDLTLPLARFYANNKDVLPSPFRSIQIGPVWRADQPAKGRYRQFVQCDIDVLGDASNLAEIELITAASVALSRVFAKANVGNLTVHVNDRRILIAAALKAGFERDDVDSVLIALDKLDKIGFDGVRAELIEKDAREEVVDAYLSMFDWGTDLITVEGFCAEINNESLSEVAGNLKEIISCASKLTPDNVLIAFDPTLVRGMGYYTGPIFEVTVEEFGISIAGGGRYDQMIGRFIGEEVCACGFSIGFERIVAVLRDSGVTGTEESGREAVALLIDKKVPFERRLEALQRAQSLRTEGKQAAVFPMRKNIRRQMDTLESAGFTSFEKIYSD